MNTRIPDEKLKNAAIKQVDAQRLQLQRLALKIHANPEPGFKEVKASGWLTAYLEKKGFIIERGICDLNTAFRASYGTGNPKIAVLAEYDALPGLGHACGHNLICTIACGAAVASKHTVDACGGTVLVIGTPSEEMYAGKVTMAKKGAFNDLDVALIVHPETFDAASSNALACQNLYVEFFGKSAHASAAPDRGINALDAMILAYNGIGALRQHIRSTARIHGIITDGGKAANVVPDHSAAEFIVRAADDAYLDEVGQKVLNCFIGAAQATGARLEYRWDELRYAAMKSNMTLAQLYADNIKTLGREARLPAPGGGGGSTDMGNVSQIVPAIHPMVAIAPRSVSIHSPEFAQAAAGESGIQGMVDAAKAMALMIVDLLGNPDILRKVKEEFSQA
ncbi:MAG: M20 family metallopeptidase [Dehalococcoidia bacterium]|nr:M20 family metallopeptidase [Dehalococcoidia bacterium]